MISRFYVRSWEESVLKVIFEPTGMEYSLQADSRILVELAGDRTDAEVVYGKDFLMIQAPTQGCVRAWDQDGIELEI